ncbi:MAG: hypothetical protein DHS20C11_16580 [Lysobacteraceae bacterium]|nr:MAG: hypothetical protein DHS20C11_16580 [Xanthomonadaceae bacterium]
MKMRASTRARLLVNKLLAPVGLQLTSTRAQEAEQRRLAELVQRGHFKDAIFNCPKPINAEWVDEFFSAKVLTDGDWQALGQVSCSSPFSIHNEYFASPDADVLHYLLTRHKPAQYIEIGSGNSTRLTRATVDAHQLSTQIVCVDPEPRVSVRSIADHVHACRVEELGVEFFSGMKPGDILFVDSSHIAMAGSDVVMLFLQVLPKLPPGVLVHVHDIFLPYEYPRHWVVDNAWPWNEQYLLQAVIEFSNQFEILWPGYFLQQTRPGFRDHFPLMRDTDNAQSFWLRRTGGN